MTRRAHLIGWQYIAMLVVQDSTQLGHLAKWAIILAYVHLKLITWNKETL